MGKSQTQKNSSVAFAPQSFQDYRLSRTNRAAACFEELSSNQGKDTLPRPLCLNTSNVEQILHNYFSAALCVEGCLVLR